MNTMTSSLDLPTEIEAKFYPISKDKLRSCLQSLGAVCSQPEILMRRVIYNKDANPLLQGTY